MYWVSKTLLCLRVKVKWDFTASVSLEDLDSNESTKLESQLLIFWFKLGTAARGGGGGLLVETAVLLSSQTGCSCLMSTWRGGGLVSTSLQFPICQTEG